MVSGGSAGIWRHASISAKVPRTVAVEFPRSQLGSLEDPVQKFYSDISGAHPRGPAEGPEIVPHVARRFVWVRAYVFSWRKSNFFIAQPVNFRCYASFSAMDGWWSFFFTVALLRFLANKNKRKQILEKKKTNRTFDPSSIDFFFLHMLS